MSYAHADNEVGDEHLVEKLFKDVSEKIGVSVHGHQPPAGFLDQRGLAIGDHWPQEVVKALNTARTFVPIMTARFFERPYCGKEWSIFEDRCHEYARDNDGVSPTVILPVLWSRPLDGDLPAFASGIQFKFDTTDILDERQRKYAEDYGRYGLLYVMQRIDITHGNAYREIVDRLVAAIIENAKTYSVKPLGAPPDLNEAIQKFPEIKHEDAANRAPKRRARFVIAAGRSVEMADVRAAAASTYGDDEEGWEWQPYPPDERTIAEFVQREATEQRLVSLWLEIDDRLITEIRKAEEKERTAVVVIVDPWSIGLPRFRESLRAFDEAQFVNCTVIVAWDLGDHETLREREALTRRLNQILERRFALRPPLHLIDGVGDATALETAIRKALLDLNMLLAVLRKPARIAGTGGAQAIPTLSVPSGDSR